ncbi:caltractin-like [Patiria miniata]|uniref:EF-hand domain-containing protein n=1 Tax=Patiria miniata TaxID=46514 RepID=A0A914ADP0_PATMI|nr:caltractin-like [Patiria miniata]XP_038062050.1 caltractin-like [Patiria miniata]XP_038062051.1 caltractin-like [Patiria miniata]
MSSTKVKKKRSKTDGNGNISDSTSSEATEARPAVSYQQKLKSVLTGEKVDLNTKEFMGCKISTKAFQQLTPHEIRDLKTVFDAFADSEGMIRADAVRRTMRALGFKLTKQQAQAMVADMDLDRSGTIDFNEFLEFIIDRQGTARDIYAEIQQGFRMFDYDGTGQISLDNLKKACKEAGVKFTEQELRDMIEEADRNGDNFVNLEEFTNVMLKTNLF